MKGEVNPVFAEIIIAVVVVVIAVFGFKTMHHSYPMSPGGGPRKLAADGTASPSSGGGSFMPSGGAGAATRISPRAGMNGGGMPTSSGPMMGNNMNGGRQ